MCISVQQLSYIHADKEPLFQNINLTVNKGEQVSLVGNNGSGKSTLLRIIEGGLKPVSGEVVCSSQPYYVPQHFGQYDQLTVMQALQVESKIKALLAIIAGDASIGNFTALDDDWNIEERCLAALSFWGLQYIRLDQPMCTLSGGEKTKVFLSGLQIHSPEIILMDEPTNHLDTGSRNKLYGFIESSRATMLIVSHDRTLLNLLPYTCELDRSTISLYGGNYEFYKEQKEQALAALQNQLSEKEKELRLAKKIAREALERKNKSSSRGEKSAVKKGIPRIMMGAMKEGAENSTVKLKNVHDDKMSAISSSITDIQTALPNMRQMKTDFNSPDLHIGKILVTAKDVNFGYGESRLWQDPLNLQIKSGDRIRFSGNNGAGKTTLLKLLLGELEPTEGTITRADFKYIYIDQEYSIVQPHLTVFEQLEQFNLFAKPEHELKMILSRFLFPVGTWDKSCSKLSGGEKMRLAICCLMVSNSTPDLFILDEPTNNLDIQSVNIITAAIKDYNGTVLLVSHDLYFVKEIKINRVVELFSSSPVIKI
ncbi:ABC-F family ATP-binding cassette domain-containing protein [Parabacteroides gordonii]|uniref:ABC-F family ATP-binding cassette domain-containing protein n=1 Tax=Parabacteroides gordonii TaxID=574930 RepID=UPI000EBC6384|nr:ABC-F family ATP-binding cassette domain-containing protein [Parabacteroides gordonii]RGP10190.1 ABC transporter ATP-binding protein [Parabacteroides gordonii]